MHREVSYPHASISASSNEGLALALCLPSAHQASICRGAKGRPCTCPHPHTGCQGPPPQCWQARVFSGWKEPVWSVLPLMGWQGASIPRKTRKAWITSCHRTLQGGQSLCAGVNREVKREVLKTQDWQAKPSVI